MAWPKGRPLSKAHRQRISRAKTGVPRRVRATEDARDRLLTAHELSPMTGAKFTRDDRGVALGATVRAQRRSR